MAANPWPSSDWVAALSERGVPAFLALVAFVVLLLGGALKTRYDSARSPDERLAALAGGGRRAHRRDRGRVRRRAAPSHAVHRRVGRGRRVARGGSGSVEPLRHRRAGGWCSPARSRRSPTLPAHSANGGSRRCDCTRWERRSAIESALTKDPGSYRIQMRAAEYFLGHAGQCALSREIVTYSLAARVLFPDEFTGAEARPGSVQELNDALKRRGIRHRSLRDAR